MLSGLEKHINVSTSHKVSQNQTEPYALKIKLNITLQLLLKGHFLLNTDLSFQYRIIWKRARI